MTTPHSPWHKFLTTQGARWQNDQLLDFTGPHALGGALIPMLDHTIICIEGPDAVKFLQGQVTCNLDDLAQGKHLLGAHCNAKGRMISSFEMAPLPGETRIGLRVRADLAHTALAALNKYMVFSKADGQISTLVPLAVIPNANSPEQQPNTPAPGEYQTHTHYTQLHHKQGLQELWVEDHYAQTLWQSTAQLVSPAPPTAWNDFWVAHGVAEVHAATSEQFIPQMFNYDLLDGISFKKGCYTGQEIIARLHYRGQAKKRTYIATISGTQNLSIGTEITSDGANIGTICGISRQNILICANTQKFDARTAIHPIDQPHLKLTWAEGAYAIP